MLHSSFVLLLGVKGGLVVGILSRTSARESKGVVLLLCDIRSSYLVTR